MSTCQIPNIQEKLTCRYLTPKMRQKKYHIPELKWLRMPCPKPHAGPESET